MLSARRSYPGTVVSMWSRHHLGYQYLFAVARAPSLGWKRVLRSSCYTCLYVFVDRIWNHRRQVLESYCLLEFPPNRQRISFGCTFENFNWLFPPRFHVIAFMIVRSATTRRPRCHFSTSAFSISAPCVAMGRGR